jgi:hypothetical protein
MQAPRKRHTFGCVISLQTRTEPQQIGLCETVGREKKKKNTEQKKKKKTTLNASSRVVTTPGERDVQARERANNEQQHSENDTS